MDNLELQELLTLQANITTVIMAFTAVILIGIIIDVYLHLFKKYKEEKKIKKEKEK